MGIQADQVSMAGCSRGLDPTMQGITPRQRGRNSDGTRNERTPSKNPGDVMYSSAHLRNIQDRQIFDKPLDERLGSRISDLKAWVQQSYSVVVYRKGFKTRTHKYVRESRTFGTSFSGSFPHQEYSDPKIYINRAVQAAERQFREELLIAGRGCLAIR
jgi:hypothetical protein